MAFKHRIDNHGAYTKQPYKLNKHYTEKGEVEKGAGRRISSQIRLTEKKRERELRGLFGTEWLQQFGRKRGCATHRIVYIYIYIYVYILLISKRAKEQTKRKL